MKIISKGSLVRIISLFGSRPARRSLLLSVATASVFCLIFSLAANADSELSPDGLTETFTGNQSGGISATTPTVTINVQDLEGGNADPGDAEDPVVYQINSNGLAEPGISLGATFL